MSQFRELLTHKGLGCSYDVDKIPSYRDKSQYIHTVEIAALEAAQKEIEKLTAALKVAEDALEREMKWRTVKYCTNDGLDNLGEALNKIKKGLA